MQQPGIVGLHCVTTANALYYGYQTTGSDETRRYLLLQAAAFLPMFKQVMIGRGGALRDLRIDTLENMDVPKGLGSGVEDIFAAVSKDRLQAARKTLAFLQTQGEPGARALIAGARRLVFSKGTDSHDYKFSSAILEDYYHATPAWRDRFLAMGSKGVSAAPAPRKLQF